MNELLIHQDKLHVAASTMLAGSGLQPLLARMGELKLAGSYTTGLMVYPDIDFSVQHQVPTVQTGIDLAPVLFETLRAVKVQVTDFSKDKNEGAAYHVGLVFPYAGESWQISATVGLAGPVVPNPPELTDWLAGMTEAQRITLLRLKRQLKEAGRYGSSTSVPPYTFRSVHVYEAVLKGGADTVAKIESYFKS